MATFGDILREIQDEQLKRQREGVTDPVRRRYLRALHKLTDRNNRRLLLRVLASARARAFLHDANQ
jgi:hypothetical protein